MSFDNWYGRSPDERFWAKVDKTDTCWLWTAAQNNAGYGIFRVTPGEAIVAHRWSYQQWHGLVPDGLELDHLCRVRNCVNPAHLEAVTGRVNNLRSDSWAGRNARKTHCINGHEFTPENTFRPNADNARQCLTCSKIRQEARRIRRIKTGAW